MPLFPCCPEWEAMPRRCGKTHKKRTSLTSAKPLGMPAKGKARLQSQTRMMEKEIKGGKESDNVRYTPNFNSRVCRTTVSIGFVN